MELGKFTPRGSRRIVYVSDPSSIAMHYLPDPANEVDLRNWVGEVASAGVDTFIQEAYTQGWTTYWRTDGFEYDARPQHRRFLSLLDSGVQPLGVLLDESHKRGMEFLAGLRVNDNHGHISVKQGVGAGASFLINNPQWQIKEFPPEPFYALSSPMDFSFKEVREFFFSAAKKLVDTFPVDGLELCFRDHSYFPWSKGRERQPLMTDLVNQIRHMLDASRKVKGKRLVLGARVYATVEECQNIGLDVPTWVRNGLVDYVAPADVMFADFNAPYDEFAVHTRATNCMLYPGVLPWTSIRHRRRNAEMPISQDQLRALTSNFYGAGP